MSRERLWVANDLLESSQGVPYRVNNAAKLTPEDIGFLAQAINDTIEKWGDPEGELTALRRKLRGEEQP